MTALSEWAGRYVDRYGFALAEIPRGRKAPMRENWQNPPYQPPSFWESHPDYGICAVLAPSHLCSLDVDHVEYARLALATIGLDLDRLAEGPPKIQGNPTRYRLMFHAPEDMDLSRRTLAWPALAEGDKGTTIFELRAGLLQDVLPPTIHPQTRKPYIWLTPPGEGFPVLPAELLELWLAWGSYESELKGACPWGTPFRPTVKPRGEGARANVIGPFNQSHAVDAILEAHGYRPKGKSRWLAPDSSTGLAGVVKLPDGHVYSHHGADPLADGHKHDAFDVFRILAHGGDTSAAVKEAAESLGIKHETRRNNVHLFAAPAVAPVDITGEDQTAPAPAIDLPEQPKYRFLPASELLAEPVPVSWLIKDALEANTFGVMFGESASCKSFLALDMACCIATGTEWRGLRVKKGTVIYMAGEGHFGIRRRLLAWQIARQVALKDAPLFVSNSTAHLPSQVADVAAAMDSVTQKIGKKPALIIVDTLARHIDGDENSTRDISDFIATLDDLRRAYDGPAVIAVHHVGHGEKTRARGAVALKCATDFEYRVERADKLVSLIATKAKDHELPEPLNFELRSVELPWLDEDGQALWSAVLDSTDKIPVAEPDDSALGKNQKKALEVLERLHQEHVERLPAHPENARVSLEDWRQASRLGRQRFPEAMDALLRRHLVVIEGIYAVPAAYLRTVRNVRNVSETDDSDSASSDDEASGLGVSETPLIRGAFRTPHFGRSSGRPDSDGFEEGVRNAVSDAGEAGEAAEPPTATSPARVVCAACQHWQGRCALGFAVSLPETPRLCPKFQTKVQQS